MFFDLVPGAQKIDKIEPWGTQGAKNGVRASHRGRTTAAKGPHRGSRAGLFYSYKVGKTANGDDLNTPLGRRPGVFC